MTITITAKYECQACWELFDDEVQAQFHCPAKKVYVCGRSDCKTAHPDAEEAEACAKGEWG